MSHPSTDRAPSEAPADPPLVGEAAPEAPPEGSAATGRDIAPEVLRGVMRLLIEHDFAPQPEVQLPGGRRADVMAVGRDGSLWIVEIKSSIEDFRTDQKWPEYREFCDALYFAVRPDFPIECLPADCGLVLADRFGGEIVRQAPVTKLPPARRKALVLRLARLASFRLAAAQDPTCAARPEARDV